MIYPPQTLKVPQASLHHLPPAAAQVKIQATALAKLILGLVRA
jgi:hypothetical protein